MFFRRVEVDRIVYKCKFRDKCHLDLKVLGSNSLPQCKSCRFKRCLQAGMRYIHPGQIELKTVKTEKLPTFITSLLFLDTRRRHRLMNFHNIEDPTLSEIVLGIEMSKLTVKHESYENSIHEWSVMSIHTTIEYFMSLELMTKIDDRDKVVLLKNFAMKATLFAGGKRAVDEMRDRVLTPDNKDVYPDTLYRLTQFSPNFLNSIRSQLAARLTELRITSEEYVLVSVILFSNPALSNLSASSRTTVTAYQQTYSNFLRQYCQLKYQQNWPTRFTDLLSLCHVINKTYEDVVHLTMLVQFYVPNIKLKKLYIELMKNSDSDT